MKLTLPDSKYKDSYLNALKEYKDEDREHYRSINQNEIENDFSAFVEKIKSRSRGENLFKGYISATEYWLIDNNAFIGRLDIRHEMTEFLRKVGGHIGYDVRPSKRKTGYGYNILKLGLEKAKGLGLKKVLLTCDKDHIASKKIIEKCGGIPAKKVSQDPGVEKLRYWISLE